MQFGQRHLQAIGLGMCVTAFVVAAVVLWQGAAPPMHALRGTAAVVDSPVDGGSMIATVSWPEGAAARSDICVVVFNEDGSVADERAGRLKAIPGEDAAGRWEVEGLAAGRYTVYVAECVTPATEAGAWIEPQFLGGANDAEAASWIDVASGDRVDVGAIALRSSRELPSASPR